MPSGLATFAFLVALLFPGFAALALWNWWHWRSNGL
jgi:hypothetical protein